MLIEAGAVYETTTGRMVKVESVVDSYDMYESTDNVGHGATPLVRHSHWWIENRVIAPKTERLDAFVDRVAERVEDPPAEQGP